MQPLPCEKYNCTCRTKAPCYSGQLFGTTRGNVQSVFHGKICIFLSGTFPITNGSLELVYLVASRPPGETSSRRTINFHSGSLPPSRCHFQARKRISSPEGSDFALLPRGLPVPCKWKETGSPAVGSMQTAYICFHTQHVHLDASSLRGNLTTECCHLPHMQAAPTGRGRQRQPARLSSAQCSREKSRRKGLHVQRWLE